MLKIPPIANLPTVGGNTMATSKFKISVTKRHEQFVRDKENKIYRIIKRNKVGVLVDFSTKSNLRIEQAVFFSHRDFLKKFTPYTD